jgi:hypothetical protein
MALTACNVALRKHNRFTGRTLRQAKAVAYLREFKQLPQPVQCTSGRGVPQVHTGVCSLHWQTWRMESTVAPSPGYNSCKQLWYHPYSNPMSPSIQWRLCCSDSGGATTEHSVMHLTAARAVAAHQTATTSKQLEQLMSISAEWGQQYAHCRREPGEGRAAPSVTMRVR